MSYKRPEDKPTGQSPEYMKRIGVQPGELARNSLYTGDQCFMVMELAQEGKMPEEWAAALGVNYHTFWYWRKRHPEFRAATDNARIVLEAYWAKAMREVAEGTIQTKVRPEVLLEIVRKRLPHLWGKDGQVDQLQPPPGVELDEDDERSIPFSDIPKITDERLQERINALLERRGRGSVPHKPRKEKP